MQFSSGLLEDHLVDARRALSAGCEQAGDGKIVDPAGNATGLVVDHVLDEVIEDLGIAAMLCDLMVDVATRLLFGQRGMLPKI